jgi:S1-C subfamily serine protease
VRRIRLAVLGLLIVLVGYASLPGSDPALPDLTTALVLEASRKAAFQMAMESLLDHGFTPVAGTPEQGFVVGEKGASGWSWGERVSVHLSGRAAGPTFLRVVSRARLGPNLTATDWTAPIMADLQRRVAERGNGPGAGQTATAACFAISAEGQLLTAHHVVAQAREIVVELADGRSLLAIIDQSAPAVDLAVLKVASPTPDFLGLAPPDSLRLGEPVFIFGFSAPSLAAGEPWYVTGSISALAGPSDELSLVQIAVPVQPRDAGGPLLNARGEVVGVVTTSAVPNPFLEATQLPPGEGEEVSWAVKIEFARPLLPHVADPPGPSDSRPEAIERARNALCLVKATP